jgi:hypothetical protein
LVHWKLVERQQYNGLGSTQIEELCCFWVDFGLDEASTHLNTKLDAFALISGLVVLLKVLLETTQQLWNFTLDALADGPTIGTQHMEININILVKHFATSHSYVLFHEVIAACEVFEHSFHLGGELVATLSFQF